jgi:hypothetical protein
MENLAEDLSDDVAEEGFESPFSGRPPGGPGRPKGSVNRKTKKPGRRTVTVTKTELDAESAEEKPEIEGFAHFFSRADIEEYQISRVRVIRKNPNEGTVGYLDDPLAGEEEIKQKWGGGTYMLQGLNTGGIIKGSLTVTIAGDPIFQSTQAEVFWRRGLGLPPKPVDNGRRDDGMSVKDMMQMMDAREEQRRKDSERQEEEKRKRDREDEDRRRREDREWALAREQAQSAADERRRKLEEESETRRKREASEGDERRKREVIEADDRRRKDAIEAQERSQQFMKEMLSIVQTNASNSLAFAKELQPKGDGNATEMLLKGVELALKLKGASEGGDEDLLTTVVKNLPDMLSSAGNAVGKAIREVKGNPSGGGDGLTLPAGPASEKMSKLIAAISAKGGDPEKVLAGIADRLLASEPGKEKPKDQRVPVVMDPGVPSATASEAPTKPTRIKPKAPSPPETTQGGKVSRLTFVG